MSVSYFPRKKIFFVAVIVFFCFLVLVTRLHHVVLDNTEANDDERYAPTLTEPSTCDRWAVVAAKDSHWASEAVRRQTRLQDWCLVIVFDQQPSASYDPEWYHGRGNRNVVFLTQNKAKELYELATMRDIPWSYNGRKVVGYLYALTHGAAAVWDFDDNNMLKFWVPYAAPPGAPSLETTVPATKTVKVRELEGHSWPTYNAHLAYLPPAQPSWPRGLPLEDTLREECSKGEIKEANVPISTLAILHSLSDRQPDADVIFQSTVPFPFYFKRTTETRPLLVPPQTLSPYNAKATLHLQPAFWAMYLPQSIDEELSDIWRSYIAQRLFWETDLRVGLTARPLVVQDHDIRFTKEKAESQLKASKKTKQLITFLGEWRGKAETFSKRIEELWTALYDKKFIQLSDVEAVKLWLKALQLVNYVFPELKEVSLSPPGYPTDTTFNLPSFPKNDIVRYTTERNKLEYSDEVCEMPATSFTFWNSDTHYGSRLDMATFLGSLGHTAYEAVGKRQDYHPEVWKMPGVHLYDRVSGIIRRNYPDYTGMNSRLTEAMVKENFEFYKNDPMIHSVDAFNSQFPASMIEMWMPFNKSLLLIPAHRYSMARCTKDEFDRLNEHLRLLAAMEHPKHFMASACKYDLEYLRHYSGIRDVMPLYAYTATYLGGNVYNPDPNHKEIPLFLCKWNSGFFWDNRFQTEIKKFKIVNQQTFFPKFLFSNFVKHRAVVYLPYAVFSYKISELYSMGIPMFFPSMKYLQNIRTIGDDRTILARYYCAHTGLGLKDSDMVPHPNSTHPYSPNLQENVDKESEYYWLQFSDFFQWPHLTYFDDFKDLEKKLDEADFDTIHRGMMKENKRRKAVLTNNWCKVFSKMEKGRKVPQDYESAIKELYGVSKLQVY